MMLFICNKMICLFTQNNKYIKCILARIMYYLSVLGFIVCKDSTSVADTRNNPSIGEGSMGGMTGSFSASGSHMDHLGATRDNLSETASTMALAGASITGSLSGSVMVNYLNRC